MYKSAADDFIGWGIESYFSACNYVVSDFLFVLVLTIGCDFYCDNPWAFHMSIKCLSCLTTFIELTS